ncbi:hypothetical protein BDN72DRAFT_833590 [Pluteus cervinus]|uniref:Uncharacterized protein n=1 Tax=Pluteus cervinus TaxID=181527 RepID=A0ACD3B8D0_9AGAR|nr:hypothetical protein BDN72DRAFT_833590 [Pluteus cervinus]
MPQPQSQKRSFDGGIHPSLPPRPSTSTGTSTSTLPGRRVVHISRNRHEANDIVMAETSPGTNTGPGQTADADADSSRPVKRRREDELTIVGASGRPSLLSRLGTGGTTTSSSGPSSAALPSNGFTRPSSHAPRTTLPLANADNPTPTSPAAMGFSIKGAARMENKTNVNFSGQGRPPEGNPTLLDRLERNSSSQIVGGDGIGRGMIGRRRGQS